MSDKPKVLDFDRVIEAILVRPRSERPYTVRDMDRSTLRNFFTDVGPFILAEIERMSDKPLPIAAAVYSTNTPVDTLSETTTYSRSEAHDRLLSLGYTGTVAERFLDGAVHALETMEPTSSAAKVLRAYLRSPVPLKDKPKAPTLTIGQALPLVREAVDKGEKDANDCGMNLLPLAELVVTASRGDGSLSQPAPEPSATTWTVAQPGPSTVHLNVPYVATLPDTARVNLPAGTTLREGVDMRPNTVEAIGLLRKARVLIGSATGLNVDHAFRALSEIEAFLRREAAREVQWVDTVLPEWFAAAEARCDAIDLSPAPWIVRDEGREGLGIDRGGVDNIGSDRFILNEGANGTRADLEFVAHARTDLPAALAWGEQQAKVAALVPGLEQANREAHQSIAKSKTKIERLKCDLSDVATMLNDRLTKATAENKHLAAELADARAETAVARRERDDFAAARDAVERLSAVRAPAVLAWESHDPEGRMCVLTMLQEEANEAERVAAEGRTKSVFAPAARAAITLLQRPETLSSKDMAPDEHEAAVRACKAATGLARTEKASPTPIAARTVALYCRCTLHVRPDGSGLGVITDPRCEIHGTEPALIVKALRAGMSWAEAAEKFGTMTSPKDTRRTLPSGPRGRPHQDDGRGHR